MTYFFILGNNPALSVAEILNKFQPKKYSLVNKDVFRVEFSEKIDEVKVIKKLGGVIKIVEVVEDNFQDLLTAVENYLPEKFEGKYKFGFSFYPIVTSDGRGGSLKKIAMDIKRELKNREISCRWVIGKGSNLSSVVVAKNKLIDKGREFVIVSGEANPSSLKLHRGKKCLGVTKAVQDFEELSFRDYNRPARDSQSGMIPPKLAQMMLNIGLQGKTDKILLDPFCGSGTILMEAILMGVKKVTGSDISEKAVKNTRKNLEWIQERFGLTKKNLVKVDSRDVAKLSQFIKNESVDVIVTEPYLGPQKKAESIEKVKKELEILYTKAINEFRKILKSNSPAGRGRIVMIWPFLRDAKESTINPGINGFQIVRQLPDEMKIEVTQRGTIIYGRKGQRVWREIVVLEKTISN